MGFLSAIGEAISGAADAVAGAVEDVVNVVEEVVTDVVETAGNAVSDVLGAAGDTLTGVPIVGGVLSGVFHWAGGVVSAVTDLAGAVVKGTLGIIGGVTAGLIRVAFGGIGGLLAWDGRVFVKGLGDFASGFLGAWIGMLGKAASLFQSIVPLEWGKRRLTTDETELLRRVFRGSVALYNVRIVPGFAGLYSVAWWGPYSFTLGNTIYLKGKDPAAEPELLVHECTHVWQYQNRGSRYVSDAIFALAIKRGQGNYIWEGNSLGGTARWEDFNAEAEAWFLQDVFYDGRKTGMDATHGGEFYDDDPVGSDVLFQVGRTDYTALARDSIAYVRHAFAWRLSALF